jgi:transcriptional regulator with XRE-family HTH domain
MNIRISQFEKRAGLSNGYFNQVSKKPSASKLEAIAKAHPTLNIDWLCTGRGEMIITAAVPDLTKPDEPAEALPAQEDSLIAELRAQIERLESKVDSLNQELGEKNALLKLLRQGEIESV